MKGVKLQYTDEGRVTFDDVAGIGESKVENPLFRKNTTTTGH